MESEAVTGQGALPSGRLQPRAMVVFCDLVGSTELSGRHEPEQYGLIVGRFVAEVRSILEQRYGGNVVGVQGDGVLALFGAPNAHGDDAERAVRAALETVERVQVLSASTERDFGERLAVRIAIHRGPIYRELDSAYGLTTNVTARLQSLAPPNGVVISDDVQRMVGSAFETASMGSHLVKGVEEPLSAHQVLGERVGPTPSYPVGALFINRLAEQEYLRSLWTRIGDDGGEGSAAVLLVGDAGVGKSYLASSFTRTVSDERTVTVELAGSAFFESEGLHPVRRLIEQTAGIDRQFDGPERLRRLRHELRRRDLDPASLLPFLAPVLGIAPDAGYLEVQLDTRRLSEAISEAAYDYLRACLGSAPSVLVVEDLQWLDGTTRALVDRIVADRIPCLILMTGRPGLDAVAGVEVVELEPFSDADTAQLIDALSTQTSLSPDERDVLIERSDGIPLYVEELVASVGQGIRPSRSPSAERTEGAVPDIIYDLLAARLRSTEDIIPVASAAAVIGRDVDLRLLETVLGRPREEIDRALETLRRQGVLELRDATDRHYRFRHELLREVAYELQPPSQRRVVHGRVADALTSGGSVKQVIDWAAAASHFDRAGRAASAVQAYENAAATGLRRGSFRDSRGHLSRAIELITSSVSQAPGRDLYEVELRLQRGYLAASEEGNSSPAAASDYRRCLELTASDPTGDEWFRVVIVLWTYHVIRGELSEAYAISDLTYRSLDRRAWYRSFNLASFGILECWSGNYRAARDLLDAFSATRDPEAEDRFVTEWLNPDDPVNGVLVASAVVDFVSGDDLAAQSQFAAAMARTDTMEFPRGSYSAAHTLTHEAWARTELGQFAVAEERIEQLSELSARHGFDSWAMVALMQSTVLSVARAEARGAASAEQCKQFASEIDKMIDIWKQFDTLYFLTYYLTVSGSLHARGGDTHLGRARLEEALRLGEETGMLFYQAETLRHLANVELHPDGKEEGLVEALTLARRQHASLFELRAAIDLAERRGVGGRADLEVAVGRMSAGGAYPELARARATLATLG